MTKNKSKGKLVIILLAFVVLATMSMACNGNGNNDTEVITGDTTADAIIEDTQDAVDTGISALCNACLIAEKLPGGDDCNCNAICHTDIVCQEEVE